MLYILDEPSIGLHSRDNSKLIATLKTLRDLGNTVIVVEHDEETMHESDYIIDVGPGAGVHGGRIVACGTPEEVAKNENSLTGGYLSGRLSIPVPAQRRPGNGNFLRVFGAEEHNLKKLDVEIPLGCFVCVTGVSGSGKSSLVNGIIHPVLADRLNNAITYPGKHERVEGDEHLDKIICIDQSPIGRTPRSNPATYTGLFGDIRDLFAQTKDAKAKGYGPGRFSFNVKGGRCEACEGDGVRCIEMHFLPDVYVTCDVCKGKRYNHDTLEVKYKGKNIFDVLDMTVEEGLQFFDGLPRIRRKLQTLYDVGLGYVKIGQSSTTLSGGEAQRVKLATELARRGTGKTVYVALRVTDDLQDVRMTTYEEIRPVLVYEPTGIYIISSGISSYMDHQDLQAFALKYSVERIIIAEVVVVTVAGDAGEGLEGGDFSRQVKPPAEIAGMPDLIDGLQKGAELVAEHSVRVRYQSYIFH